MLLALALATWAVLITWFFVWDHITTTTQQKGWNDR